ncbi:phosphonate C-P lyase system protein PhnH [Celeribacter marinus]|uniref:phosphonate C-P lyase system protein PhnH n=1 Tax=Celeribacter marinus TaxID=1397108 RepID=UPI003F6D62E8
MEIQALSGGFTNAPVQSAHAFRALLEALARPGTIHNIHGASGPAPLSAAAATLILTLCDPETPLHLSGAFDCAVVRDWVTFHTGAPLVGAHHAAVVVGAWDDLSAVDQFAIGTAEYPDRSTTVIVEMDRLTACGAALTGPGIKDRAALNLPRSDVFVRNASLFPLGLDFYFTAGTKVAGLPRTTRVDFDAKEVL